MAAKTARKKTTKAKAKPKAKARAKAKPRAAAKSRAKAVAKPKASVRPKATPKGVSDREHLIDVIQSGTESSKKAAKETLDALINTVTTSLKQNQKVQLVGFGTFQVTRRPARKGRNPRTGEAIKVKASKSVRFKAGASLKGAV